MKKLGLLLVSLTLLAGCGEVSSTSELTTFVDPTTEETTELTIEIETTSETTIDETSESSIEESSSEETTTSEQSTTSEPSSSKEEDVYTLNKTQLSLEVGETFKLEVLKNGNKYYGIVSFESNSDYAYVDKRGVVTGIYPIALSKGACITVTVKNQTLKCKVGVTAPNTPIYKLMSSIGEGSAGKVEGDDRYHVIYTVTKTESGTTWGGMEFQYKHTFEYDSLTQECLIRSYAYTHYKADSVAVTYYGVNSFIWGDYKNGLFGGAYAETKVDVFPNITYQATVKFNNNFMVFKEDEYIFGIHSSSGYYTVLRDDFEENGYEPIEVEKINTIFTDYVYDCKDFADKEVFADYNKEHPSDPIRLF